ncbi:MAG: hypothetical protein EZS28_026849 [Streblomastix strix]|uniref:Uncharacterized protein n=1 Tax=Streblomastix strix TaxID=222440 RepID=A0A5J4V5I1_9EUKA|nr:MAG: hypothetical protein EZS28_026849 [Streblomastix strix]
MMIIKKKMKMIKKKNKNKIYLTQIVSSRPSRWKAFVLIMPSSFKRTAKMQEEQSIRMFFKSEIAKIQKIMKISVNCKVSYASPKGRLDSGTFV